MVRIVQAHISNGQIVPDEPLPAADQVERVQIVLEVVDSNQQVDSEDELIWMRGLLKGMDDPKDNYRGHLEEKYL